MFTDLHYQLLNSIAITLLSLQRVKIQVVIATIFNQYTIQEKKELSPTDENISSPRFHIAEN